MTQYIQKGNYEATEFDGEWIILNTDEYTITKLNDVGGQCWSLLSEVQTTKSITQFLLDTFPSFENKEQIHKDVQEFMNNLYQYGLIEHVD